MKTPFCFEKINIIFGDIIKSQTEAIVNAANSSLLGGGGVDGAIHRAAGSELLKECFSLNGCETGEAKITKGYKLSSKYIIHTVGPVYKNGKNNEKKFLSKAYNSCMKIAKKNRIKSLSFPAISTGVYNYPKKEACEIAIKTVIKFMENNDFTPDIYFVLFDSESYEIYKTTFERIKNEFSGKT